MLIALTLLGVVIIAALGWYAWHLTRQVKTMEAAQLAEQQKAEQQLRQRQHELVKDIRFLCSSVITEQCEITEGVMRIHYLVQALDPACWATDELATMRLFHGEVGGMPILDDYKKLTPKEQFKIDKQRLELEATHKEAIHKELQWLVSFEFPAVFLLH
ncbi:DUF2489 domain-containing protein [Oceanobacter mangrovi]|uniref:DUF2489 domain-containing protein n=1 Tax=Oceanobacter mangrovi TaxID=2862510 RepID=UPI001C8D804E|nr:DUF2489 domain-containing protein [Oceanobacter mangrovi]